MPADIPSEKWILTQGHNRESVSKILYRDGAPTNWTYKEPQEDNTEQTPVERSVNENFWQPISALLYSTLNPSTKVDTNLFTALKSSLQHLRQDQEKLIVSISNGTSPEDQPTMIHENMLMSAYSALEVLRVLPRLCEQIREKVIQVKTPHPLKAQVPKDWVKDVDAEVKGCYDAIGQVANGYIALLQKKGVAAIRAQVKFGATGEALKGLLSDDDVEYYAKEYVDSAVEAWKGVLQVKLK
jgi:N-terminal acetyltransferase B complex non-catalytic subunit